MSYNLRIYLYLTFIMLCLSGYSQKFYTPIALNDLPNKDVQALYQDKTGYIWIATRNGLFSYDGFKIKIYKSNFKNPNLFTNNNISDIAEDDKNRLWIGTYSGLNYYDKSTGNVVKILDKEFITLPVSKILVTSLGRILIGTENGVFEYIDEKDSIGKLIRFKGVDELPQMSVKSLMEDNRGDIWIGSWSNGLYRWDISKDSIIQYPKFNVQNSAHVLYQDEHRNIWVGSWRGGLTMLKNAWDLDKLEYITFRNTETDDSSILDDVIYSISEDVHTNTLWIGTRKGLSLLPYTLEYSGDETFINISPNNSSNSINSDEVTSIVRDKQGMMWIGMIGGGVNCANTFDPTIEVDHLMELRKEWKTSSVRSLFLDDNKNLWFGLGTRGFCIKNIETGKYMSYYDLPGFSEYKIIPTVSHIMKYSVNGNLLLSTSGGVFELSPGNIKGSARKMTFKDPKINTEPIVNSIFEDSKKNLWFATKKGIAMLSKDGVETSFSDRIVDGIPFYKLLTTQIAEDSKGNIWAASPTHGVYKLSYNANDTYDISLYSPMNNKFISYADCIFCDSRGVLWVGSASCGLSYYNEETDSFIIAHDKWNLPGDAVVSIIEDNDGCLWVATNVGLLKINVSNNLSEHSFRLYTTSDGLQDNIFNRNVIFKSGNGRIYIGGHYGYNSFSPNNMSEMYSKISPAITDIKINNSSWYTLPYKEKQEISVSSPLYSKQMTLDYRHNNFSIEFSAMSYGRNIRNLFAYRLDGIDKDWVYVDSSQRFAIYNNLKSGTYYFHLKSSNGHDLWSDDNIMMKITVLPEPWKTWWAYLIYICIVAVAFVYGYLNVRNRIRYRSILHMHDIERRKVEEVSHAKLQFFTNITHELLTPLTILSASVDDIKQSVQPKEETLSVMSNNINRLVRLIQQILEFRKAESGNLKLLVSMLDILYFVRQSVDSFRPLMKKKNIILDFLCEEKSIIGYIDKDKLDKILYNLLSNASKYNYYGGKVVVELRRVNDIIVINVCDNGPGMSEDEQKDLFKRFYEGRYRDFNTIGTGIGLSLVNDLVKLHHGNIKVSSVKGQGTVFTVELPVELSYYSENEISSYSLVQTQENIEDSDYNDASLHVYNGEDHEAGLTKTILIVEDDEDLSSVIYKLLSVDFIVKKASNGQEALDIVSEFDIDLIISDVMMPVMDGIELCNVIKGNIETCHIPIILLTAKVGESDKIEGYNAGADAYIEKPFNLSVLHARILNLIKSKERKNIDFRKQLVFESKELNYTSLDEDFLKRAVDCVNSHLDDPNFDHTTFSNELGMSKSTCFRKLKSLTGLSYSSFVRNIRMKAACKIMEEKSGIRVSELAYLVGYNDPRYFSSCFKKEFGMLPTDYQEKFNQGDMK